VNKKFKRETTDREKAAGWPLRTNANRRGVILSWCEGVDWCEGGF